MIAKKNPLKNEPLKQSLKTLEIRISQIEIRNKRVESDKAWESSLSRKFLIATTTYIVIGLYFVLVLRVVHPWINTLVPTLGFLLSTLTLQLFKNLWVKYLYKK